MNKTVLERFIAKYNLGGAAESVFLKASGQSLSTQFITDDKNALGIISTSQLNMDEGSYAIYDTAKLSSLLSVLGDDVRIKVNKEGNRAMSLGLSDGATKVTFILADPNTIPAAPDVKKIPPYDVTIKLDEKFMSTFVKAKNALPEVDTFTVIGDGKRTQVVLGYSALNTNRVTFEVETDQVKTIEPIHFSARYMRDIILANKEAKNGTLKVSEKGLAHASFEIDGFNVEYYLVQIKTS